MLFKDFSNCSSGGYFVAEVEPLCNFGRGHYGEHSCEIILNFDPWFRTDYVNVYFHFIS